MADKPSRALVIYGDGHAKLVSPLHSDLHSFASCGFLSLRDPPEAQDSDWGGSKEYMKSTSGHCFSLGSGMIIWNSKKQEVVAQSTVEAEYVAATAATNQAIWFRKMLSDLNHDQEVATTILCDNKSAIAMSQNSVFHNRTKYMKIKFYYLKEMEKERQIHMEHISTEEMAADVLTKLLPRARFEKLRERLGIICNFDVKEEIVAVDIKLSYNTKKTSAT